MLSANPQKIKRALVWLKRHNHLYRHIQISEDALRSWGQWCPGTEVPQAVFDEMVPYELHAEDQIRTGHYVPAWSFFVSPGTPPLLRQSPPPLTS